ncbi:MAG TPA: Mur ligase domain-containing protein [Caulobacteraceae bacterium]|jgi:UDP-N-acetylmuramate: L-alanyl-gamma-D-glutamyl-meso-diaminopimelate ligase
MKVYFLGIAGAGVSALASLMASEGHEVSGSDGAVYPPVSTYLEGLGIPFHRGFDAAHVPPDLDLAIIGSSAALDLAHNPELARLRQLGVPQLSFAEYLGQYSAGRDTCVVAGSFGKSTLTAMTATMLRAAGRDPGYFIGAVPLDLPTTGHAGRDPAFLLEGDEYIVSPEDRRSKFLLYKARALLLSSLVHDHLNVFPTMASYEAPFAQLVAQLPADGLIVAARGFEPLERVTAGRPVNWYGVGEGPGYSALDIEIGEITRFDLRLPSGRRVALETELLGLHNIENIAGACALLVEWGKLTPDELALGVRAFRGVARRLDKKTAVSSAPAYEGFGSSYEKARSAIEAIALHFPSRPMIVVFEPHTFSWRGEEALAWYDTVFEGAASVLVIPPPEHGAGTHRQLTQAEIVARIRAAGVDAHAATGADAVIADLAQRMRGDEVVLLLSSGPLDGLAARLPAWLDQRFASGQPSRSTSTSGPATRNAS